MAQSEFNEGESYALGPRLLRALPDDVQYLDTEEVAWRVYERDARHDPGAHLPACLIFESLDTIRRVWVYPRVWRTLDPVALESLSWQR